MNKTIFVIFWGYDKEKAPVWEANISIDDNEPVNPSDTSVVQFDDEAQAKAFLEEHYTGVVTPEILDMEQALDVYEDYKTYIEKQSS